MLTEIAAYLVSKNIGTLGTDLFAAFMPDKPDNCVALFEYAGQPMELTMGDSDPVLERPGLQVKVRNTDYQTGKAKIDDIVDVLHGLANQVLSVPAAESEPAPEGPNGDNGVVGEDDEVEDDDTPETEETPEPIPQGTRYLLIKANQSPESMGLDQNNRSEFVVNFSVIKER